MKTVRPKVALACEYLAAGPYMKHTLVNMYASGDIAVESFPANIPMAFYIEFEANFAGRHEIEFQVILGRKLIAKLIAEFKFELGKMGLVTLPQLVLLIDKPNELRIVAKNSEIRSTTLVKRKFMQGSLPPTSVSQ